MDRDVFDGLTKLLAASPSRRAALGTGVGLLLAGPATPAGATPKRRRKRRRRPGAGDCNGVPPGRCESLWATCQGALDAVLGTEFQARNSGCCEVLAEERSFLILNDICLEWYFCPLSHAAAPAPRPWPGQSFDGPCAYLGPKCEESLTRHHRGHATSCCTALAKCEVGTYVRCLIARRVLCPPPPG